MLFEMKSKKKELTMDLPSWPCFTEEEANAVQNVLLSNRVNYWTGQECRKFEEEFAQWVDTKFAIALANGTAALEIALRAAGIGINDEVIVTSRTFIASASSIVAVGAKPVFADIDKDSQNISIDTINAVLTSRTKAIICVHLAGWPCDMDSIMTLASSNDLYVIEDCAQAHGALYNGCSVGSIGHIAAWSFCQDKIMTTGGEGGMVTTNDQELWSRMWSYKDHGKSWGTIYGQQQSPGFRWLHESFGTNMRLTEMQAAIGRIQLKRMPDWHKKRLSNARKIWESASNLKALRVPTIPSKVEHAAYKCYVFVKPEWLKGGWDRDKIMDEINARKIPCYSGSCSEIYLEKAFEGTGWHPEQRLPNAKELGETSLMFLVHPTLTDEEISKTCEILNEVILRASQ